MINSMTAFASEEDTQDNTTISIEIRCYNSRHLDPSIRLAPSHANLEEPVRQMISQFIQRGRVEIRINVKRETQEAIAFNINELLADAYYNTLNNIRTRYSLPEPVSLDHLLKFSGIIEPMAPEFDSSAILSLLGEVITRGFEKVNRMREAEGKAIADDLSKRITHIETCIMQIENQADGLLERHYQKLVDRINELTQGVVEIDQGRLAQEAALLADKGDISEEITRARSHLDQFRKLMDSDEPAGKPLNFLLQEFSREFNTMGSKAGNTDISHIIVSAKTEIEKIREQVQNVE